MKLSKLVIVGIIVLGLAVMASNLWIVGASYSDDSDSDYDGDGDTDVQYTNTLSFLRSGDVVLTQPFSFC